MSQEKITHRLAASKSRGSLKVNSRDKLNKDKSKAPLADCILEPVFGNYHPECDRSFLLTWRYVMLLPVIVQIETTDRLKPIVIETTVHPTAEAAIEYAEEVTYGARVNQRGRALVQIGSNLIDGGMAFYQQLAEFEWDASAEKLTRHTINLKALAAWNLRLLNEDDKLADAPKPLD